MFWTRSARTTPARPAAEEDSGEAAGMEEGVPAVLDARALPGVAYGGDAIHEGAGGSAAYAAMALLSTL